MSAVMSIKEAAALWGLTERRVNELCKTGRIEGARKEGRVWIIPADAQKPADKRFKEGHPGPLPHTGSASMPYKTSPHPNFSIGSFLLREASVANAGTGRLPLPIGISDYRKASTSYYYVDKTLLIRDFLDERPQVSLFTRPRRFGKTLNMDMLRTFFERTHEDTSFYFRDKKIWLCGENYQMYQGKFPVIFLSFKDVKFETWEETLENIGAVLRREFDRHSELSESAACSRSEKAAYQKIINGTAGNVELTSALALLSQMLDEHYGIAPIIIVDEYDTPVQQGYMCGYYEEVILFMRNLFSGGLKDNRHLSYGFLTGILRVAKESIFSGLNNLKINSIMDNKYSEYFGFTPEEVQEMADYYGVPENYEEICSWYNGYRFGGRDIFNPWSVINYFGNDCRPRAFWQATGSNDIISQVLAEATPETMERLKSLMQGQSFVTHINADVIYPQIRKEPSSIYSFLLVAGYLKTLEIDPQFSGDYMCRVALPNKEISFVYTKEILSRLESVIPQSSAIAIQEAIYTGDISALQNRLEKFLRQTISYNDAAKETFYHGLVLGLCAMLDNRYRITSNRESGTGRFDIQMQPLMEKLPGVLIELKAEKDCSEERLEALAQAALEQINSKEYDLEMETSGVGRILKYGVAFCGKTVRIAVGG